MNDEMTSHYFNTAAAGLLPARYTEKAGIFLRQMAVNASGANDEWYQLHMNSLRQSAAGFLDAEVNETVFIPNFSFGLYALVQSIPANKRTMVLHEDYPSIIDPLRLSGFRALRLKSVHKIFFNQEEIMVALLAHSIELLVISHVQWLTGFRIDLDALGEFCRSKGIIMIVDATQSMGAMPLSLKRSGADAIISSNYKWMNAGFGTGIMCVRRDFLEQYPPKIRGNHSRMISGGKWTDDASVLGFEPGHLNVPGLIIAGEAIADKIHSDTAEIFKHNMRLTSWFIESLPNPASLLVGPTSTEFRSSIISLKGGELLYNHLMKRGFVVSLRNGAVRVSFHYHNTQAEVNELIETLHRFEKAPHK